MMDSVQVTQGRFVHIQTMVSKHLIRRRILDQALQLIQGEMCKAPCSEDYLCTLLLVDRYTWRHRTK